MKLKAGQKVFFIGIGGSGMMPLAKLARQIGMNVFGSDSGLDEIRKSELRNLGILVHDSHGAENITEGIVVYSSAIRPDHVELSAAKNLEKTGRAQVLHRMDFLNAIVDACSVQFAVSGTHGKTTTSSMIGWALLELGADPTIIAGGKPAYLPDGARLGGGKIAVYETDESDGSFLKSHAQIRLCLNVDSDHLEHYGSFENLCESFSRFMREGEISFVYENDPALAKAAKEFNLKSYATLETPFRHSGEISAEYVGKFPGDSDTMEITHPGGSATLTLLMPGKHFARNALGAFACIDTAVREGVLESLKNYSPQRLVEILSRFPGVERRIEKITEIRGCPVYDDYGHHPTEIAAVLNALRGRMEKGRSLIAVFQPHRYTRTRALFREFARALDLADRIYLLPLYSAGENPITGADSLSILNELDAKKACLIENGKFSPIIDNLVGGDNVVFLGAGDISKQIRKYLAGSH